RPVSSGRQVRAGWECRPRAESTGTIDDAFASGRTNLRGNLVLYALGVLGFAIGLLASIALHEIGHLVPAKKFGVRVTQYMVGFGPTLLSRRRGETEYGIKAI